jgi:hypothetical protein
MLDMNVTSMKRRQISTAEMLESTITFNPTSDDDASESRRTHEAT